MSYNMSWETQAGENLNKHTNDCYKKYGDIRECTVKAIKNLNFKLIGNLDLFAIQEVYLENLPELIQTQQHTLDRFHSENYLTLMWNSEKFGKLLYAKNYNSVEFLGMKYEIRPLTIYLFSEYCIINVHLFHTKETKKLLELVIHRIISESPKKDKIVDMIQSKKLIMLGDFNDHGETIHKRSPLDIFQIKYSQGFSKTYLNKKLKTCCYGMKKRKPGDYIIAYNIKDLYIPENFKNKLSSDHYPVCAIIHSSN